MQRLPQRLGFDLSVPTRHACGSEFAEGLFDRLALRARSHEVGAFGVAPANGDCHRRVAQALSRVRVARRQERGHAIGMVVAGRQNQRCVSVFVKGRRIAVRQQESHALPAAKVRRKHQGRLAPFRDPEGIGPRKQDCNAFGMTVGCGGHQMVLPPGVVGRTRRKKLNAGGAAALRSVPKRAIVKPLTLFAHFGSEINGGPREQLGDA